ncbi:hypothetical protein K501DRAFT_261354 [Backusella circina FSU 941]|nr:hypothetical protein K501DRAFT_261354 [Backusella circina FSU 941]
MSSIEDLFGKLAMTTVTTVSRIALSHATNAAIRNVTSYLTTQLPKNKPDSKEIQTLQRQLDLKVKNLKPTIDIIARSVADGNSDLEPALEMCNDLRHDIDDFAEQVDGGSVDQIKMRLSRLLSNVDDAIPSLHLALRSIGSHDATISPSHLLHASRILMGHTGIFSVKFYSLFTANVRTTTTTDTKPFTWKEEFHKAQLSLKRDQDPERDYKVLVKEDLDDGLYHEEVNEKGGEAEGNICALDVSCIERMYYTQSGELLNIEDAKSPVLVIKVLKQKKQVDKKVKVEETSPDIDKDELQDANWYAVELWSEDEDSDSDNDDDTKTRTVKVNPMNLLLLEATIKLAMLEVSEQMDHMEASDELLNLYMA